VADEELAPAGEPEDDAVLPADEAQPGNEADPIVELAVKMGWKPKDEFHGDEAEFREPADFILASRDINRSVSRELRSVREQLDRVTSTSTQILADKLAEKDAYWQGVHRKAVDDGDHAAAERATEERLKLKAQPAQEQEPPETQAFRQRHSGWFGKDRVATARAMEVAEKSMRLGASPAEQLEDAERAIRREFPELFPKAAKQAPGVQTGSSRNTGGGSREKGFVDMPAESQKLAIEYEQRHGVKREDFAKSYWNEQAQRRAG
jgi:hypothetical protein